MVHRYILPAMPRNYDHFSDTMDVDEASQAPCTVPEEHTDVFKFVLPPEIANFPPFSPPFRFLDLPPELRNMIAAATFASDTHGLTPPNITQLNRQLRVDYLKMFYDQTDIFQVPVTTSGQVTALLHWLTHGMDCKLRVGKAIEFLYTDYRTGKTKVRLTREEVKPAKLVADLDADPALKLARRNSYNPQPRIPMTSLQMVFSDCLGLPDMNELWLCLTYRKLFLKMNERFAKAVADDETWTTYRLTVTEEQAMRKCFCMWQLKTLVYVLGDLEGRVAGVGDWRKIAMHLFRQHMIGEKKTRSV